MSYAANPAEFLRHAILLAPALVGFSMPLAWLPLAIGAGASARPSDVCRRRWVLASSTLMCVLTLVCLSGFVTPAANQAWREATAGRELTPGLRELSLPRLAEAAVAGAPGATRESRDKLVVSVVWPIALALFGWRLGRHRTDVRYRALVGWWLLSVAPIAVVELSKHAPDYDQAPWAWPALALIWLAAGVSLRPTSLAVEPRSP